MLWRKDAIIQWIISHRNKYEPYMLKKYLMGIGDQVRPLYDKYKIDEMGKERVHHSASSALPL